MPRQNWAGNYRYRAARIHLPRTVAEIQERVAACRFVKALGTRHSFNDIADTDEELLSMEQFQRVVSLDHERKTVTVEAGIKYGDLCRFLHSEGYALHNLASLPHISVAGACATATHGSGDANGNLATAVSALEMVTADGTLRRFSRELNGETFQGMVVGLGALGVVTQLTLDIQPTFMMRQTVYENLPLAQLEQNFDAITGRAYSVSLFTDWQNAGFNQVWLKERIEKGAEESLEQHWFGATQATRNLHPLISLSAENCTEQQSVVGDWHDRLPHFRIEFTPSNGAELQTEYFVPRSQAIAALHAVFALSEQIAPLLFISEIRTVAADTLWMSPCYGRDSVGIHFTWKPMIDQVKEVTQEIEDALEPFEARPHWGKVFTMASGHLQSLYPQFEKFRGLAFALDPNAKFNNAFLATHLFMHS